MFYFSINPIVDNDNVLTPYPYPSDPNIAKHFYEEYELNKDKPKETDTGKAKAEEKVKKKNHFILIYKKIVFF